MHISYVRYMYILRICLFGTDVFALISAFPNATVYCPNYMANINNIPLDPTQPFTYTLLEGFLRDMAEVFDDKYLHLGGDEVVFGCWQENNAVTVCTHFPEKGLHEIRGGVVMAVATFLKDLKGVSLLCSCEVTFFCLHQFFIFFR